MILPQLFGRKKVNFACLKRVDFAVPANLVVGPVAGIANPEPAVFSQHAGNKGPDLNAYRVIDVPVENGCHGSTGQVDRATRIPVGGQPRSRSDTGFSSISGNDLPIRRALDGSLSNLETEGLR